MTVTMIMIGAYLNMQLTFMLKDKKMFNIPPEEIGRKVSNLVTYSIPFSIITIYFASYAFEIFGRKKTLFICYLITSGLYFCIPWCSPSYTKLMFIRCCIGISMAPPLAHPLIADYIHKGSRGKMIALVGMGTIIGEIFAVLTFKVQTLLEQDFYWSFT